MKEGAFVFDVDNTLLPKKKKVGDFPELAELLMSLTREGVEVAVISGNSEPLQMDQVIYPLRAAMAAKGEVRLMERVTLYVHLPICINPPSIYRTYHPLFPQ